MKPLTSILAATDFSLDASHAVRRAALLAHQHGASLHIVHVVEPAGCAALRDWFTPSIDLDLKCAQARATLRGFAAEIAGRHDVATSIEVRIGDTLQTLVQASERADLVVLGQRGHSGLKALLIGRTADRLLRTSRCPVLVVKQAAATPYQHVLLPIDFTPASDAAAQVAARVVRGAGVHALHAVDAHREALLRRAGVDDSVIREARARQASGLGARMRRKLARLGLDGTRMSFVVERGAAAPALLHHARRLGVDLIIAGKQGRSSVGSFLLGSVSSRVLSESECDMLIVPRPRSAPAAAQAGVPPRSAVRRLAP